MPPRNLQQPQGTSDIFSLKLARASLAAQIPSDEDYQALQDAKKASDDARRAQQKEQLDRLDEAIAAVEAE